MIRRWAVPALLLAAPLAPGAAHAQADTDTTGFEKILVELSIGRYGSRTVPAYRASGDALLPVLQLAVLLAVVTAVFTAPQLANQPDLLAQLRDPVGYRPPPTSWLALGMLVPSVLFGCWWMMVMTAVYRTQVPRVD